MTIEHLNNLVLIKISGKDASSFLQGQLTNDITLLSKNWQFSGYCTPKGRLLALFILWKQEDCFYALLADDLLELVVKRLRMYVMRSNVSIEHIKDTNIVGAFSKEDVINVAPAVAEKINFSDEPDNNPIALNNQIFISKECVAIKINTRFILITNNIPNTHTLSKDNKWEQHNIEDGLPTITAASAELFVPQMINLDTLDGINFKKGCYTGQEIVARMHYLGKLKQRMFVCDYKSDDLVQIADKVFSDKEGTKNVGTIVLASKHNKSALAVIRLEYKDKPLYLADGSHLAIRAKQPY